jgi:hypothetical protein
MYGPFSYARLLEKLNITWVVVQDLHLRYKMVVDVLPAAIHCTKRNQPRLGRQHSYRS